MVHGFLRAIYTVTYNILIGMIKLKKNEKREGPGEAKGGVKGGSLAHRPQESIR